MVGAEEECYNDDAKDDPECFLSNHAIYYTLAFSFSLYMADQFTPSFEQALEADIRRLAEEVEKHRERPENQSVGDQEILKRSLEVFTQGATPVSQGARDDSKSPLPSYAQSVSSETKLEIEYLLDLALREGIMRAAVEAKKSNPFVLDAFHDALTGRLYPEFQKRGILK
jgi:hypothetical protein